MKPTASKKSGRKQGKPAAGIRAPRARLEWWGILLLALVAFLAFARTIPYDFVFDDEFQVQRNPWIRDWSRVGEIFTTNVWEFSNPHTQSNYYRPIHMLLHMLSYGISGLEPHGYHLINILLHSLCTVWIVLIGFLLTGNKFVSYAGGLIFALHPIHAESVSWIAAVPDPSCAFFYFGALYYYCKDQKDESKCLPLTLTLVFFLFALLSKEMAFSFPLAAVAMDWLFEKRLRWSRYAFLAGVFGLYLFLRITALSGFVVRELPLALDLPSRLMSILVLLSQYLLKSFAPHDIHGYHVFVPTRSILSVEFALAMAIFALYGAAIWFFRRHREVLFLLTFGLLTLFPVLNISRIGETPFADRYLYIPTLGASLLIPIVARELWARRPALVKLSGAHAGGAALSILALGFGHQLWDTSAMWRDAPTFYRETLARSPNATLMASNLATYLYRRGELAEAEQWYRKALEFWNKGFVKNEVNLAGIYGGLGAVCLKQNKLPEAKEYFLRASEITPGSFPVIQNLGSVAFAMGNRAEALKYYKEALELNPRSEWSYNNLAVLYLAEGKFDAAIEMARKAVDIFPQGAESHIIMGKAYAGKGMREEARRSFLTARQVDPSKAGLADQELGALDKGTR